MKTKFLIVLSLIVLLAAVAVVSADDSVANFNSNPGTVWLTKGSCGNISQSQSEFVAGDKVFLNGKNFPKGNYLWNFEGENNSCNPGGVVINASVYIGNTGKFCVPVSGYSVSANDCGFYNATIVDKNKCKFDDHDRCWVDSSKDISGFGHEDDKDKKMCKSGKSVEFHVNTTPSVPEFGMIAGLTTVLAAVGTFFFIRRK